MQLVSWVKWPMVVDVWPRITVGPRVKPEDDGGGLVGSAAGMIKVCKTMLQLGDNALK